MLQPRCHRLLSTVSAYRGIEAGVFILYQVWSMLAHAFEGGPLERSLNTEEQFLNEKGLISSGLFELVTSVM